MLAVSVCPIHQSRSHLPRVQGSGAADILVGIVVLTLNQREKTLACLASLTPGRHPFQTLVWDNGSEDGTIKAVQREFPDVLTHHHESNLGVASGRNAAAALLTRQVAASHLLFLDNDMLVEPGFVDALLQPMLDDPAVGQTQAKLRFMHDRARLNDGGGCSINWLLGRTMPVGFEEIDRGQYDTPARCVACGGAMMVRTTVFQQLGGFDARFDPFGPEDLDFSLRLAKAGYVAMYAPRAVAYHQVSHTFGGGYNEQYARHKARHWLTFMRRHAPLVQQIGFFTIGAPYLALRMAAREGRRGNLKALRGTLRGMLDLVRPSRGKPPGAA